MLPTPHPAVVTQEVSEGTVLLQTEQEVYYGLNAVGTVVWELLAGECDDLDALVEGVCTAYPDADPGRVREDVRALLADLEASGLLRPPTPAGAV